MSGKLDPGSPQTSSERLSWVGQRWMTAYLKGVRDYHEAIFKAGQLRHEVISTLSKWTGVTDPDLYQKMGFPAIDPNGHVNQESVADQLNFHREQGSVTAPLELQQLMDTRFAEAAVQQLGVYQL